MLGHLLPQNNYHLIYYVFYVLFISRIDAAAPQPEEQPAISHSH